MPLAEPAARIACYHCGDECHDSEIHVEEKVFCCEGCKTVYQIINKNGLCDYYDLTAAPGTNRKIRVRDDKFAFLDNSGIVAKLIHFKDGNQEHVRLYLPQMHCASCIWLLEHLPKLNPGILHATVDFLKKEVTVCYQSDKVSLRHVAELLTAVGYEPYISLRDMESKARPVNRSRIYKIGIAGFCFGNIMMLSFPEYFASGDIGEKDLQKTFSILNLVLALPVFFYCASDFFVSAWKGLRQKFLNIDAPIALAILITFGRSVFEIVTGTGVGYLDSMSGIVFFMLVGRFFQDKTYSSLSFDRDYRSYFPIGVTRLVNEKETQIPVSDIRVGDRLRIHSDEIIPADGILFLGEAHIDYSFVTGESIPAAKSIGELVYAGGRQVGGAIEMEVVREVSQSYLTQLWNNEVFRRPGEEKKVSFVHKLSRYFTYILFTIAALTAVYWQTHDPSRLWPSVTAILIVACPCALLLSATFTNGHMLGILQRAGFFARNATVLESIAEADTIVFDKTGTISHRHTATVSFEGPSLSDWQKGIIRAVAIQSSHPLSKAVASFLDVHMRIPVKHFREEKGRGARAFVAGEEVRIGSFSFVSGEDRAGGEGTRVHVSVNGEMLGAFVIHVSYRDGLPLLIQQLRKSYRLCVISGDNAGEEKVLRKVFGDEAELLFEQSPQQKLDFVKSQQALGHKVVMIGDGLNDAGALQQSDAGIVISDDINNFSPACDAILDGDSFIRLKRILDYCRRERPIIHGSFVISIMYNVVGLFYSVQGLLSPVIAAILMPASTLSILLYTTVTSRVFGRHLKK